MVAMLRAMQTDEDLYAIRESLDRELRPYRGKMTADQFCHAGAPLPRYRAAGTLATSAAQSVLPALDSDTLWAVMLSAQSARRPSSPTSTLQPTTLQWVALVLLVISVAINYADRGNLGVAANSIQTDLHFSPKYLGMLSTAFFWTYALFQIVAGKLIDRWNVNWVYAIGFLVWSAATGLTGLVSSFILIFILRLAARHGRVDRLSRLLEDHRHHLPGATARHRQRPDRCRLENRAGPWASCSASKCSSGFSWRGMFLVIGGASLLWLMPWCFAAAKLLWRSINKASAWAPTYKQLMTRRTVWGTVLGLFGGNYAWYFYLTWLPYYFETRAPLHERPAGALRRRFRFAQSLSRPCSSECWPMQPLSGANIPDVYARCLCLSDY